MPTSINKVLKRLPKHSRDRVIARLEYMIQEEMRKARLEGFVKAKKAEKENSK